jgi:hypothetical protein
VRPHEYNYWLWAVLPPDSSFEISRIQLYLEKFPKFFLLKISTQNRNSLDIEKSYSYAGFAVAANPKNSI